MMVKIGGRVAKRCNKALEGEVSKAGQAADHEAVNGCSAQDLAAVPSSKVTKICPLRGV